MPRKHRFFAVNTLVAECVDCRVRFDMPWKEETEEKRLAALTPDYGSYRQVGYCRAVMHAYFNPSIHILKADSLGLKNIKPGEIFMLGDAAENYTAIKKQIPQLQCIDDLPRSSCNLDIIPLDAFELIHHTNHTGEYPYAHLGFISPRA